MQGFYSITKNIGMLAILIVIGYVSARLKYLPEPEKAKDVISKIILRLTLPLLFITSLTQTDLTGGMVANALTVALIAVLVIPSMFLLAYIIGKMLKMPYKTLVVHCCLCSFGNVIFLGYPLLQALYGKEALFYTAIYAVINDATFYTLGVFLISKCSDEASNKGSLKRLINPLTISFIIAVFMMALRLKLPEFVFEPLSMLAQCTVPLAMLFTGIVLAQVKPSGVFLPWTKYVGIALKQFIVPVLLALLLRTFELAPVVFGVLIMQVAMPSQTMVSVFANEYGADRQYAAETFFLSMIIALVSLPFTYKSIEFLLSL